MPGVLDAGGPPPVPNPGQTAMPSAGGPLSAPGMPSPPVQPGQGPQTPAPTHGETVAALRHFGAIQAELAMLLKDPAVGRSNLKSKIIDGVTKLVSNRIVTPGAAVSQLASVPDQPFQQRKWLETHLAQAFMAQVAVLGHHANAYGGTPEHMVDKTSSPDDHIADMQGVMGHYGRG
jgi:hypothetical protein